MKAQTFPSRVSAVLLVLLLLALTACGSESSVPQATSTPLPRFEQVATSTEAPVIATLIATQASSSAEDVPAINPTAAARGQGSWIRLECFTCHGQQGEGNSGPNEAQNGPAIAGSERDVAAAAIAAPPSATKCRRLISRHASVPQQFPSVEALCASGLPDRRSLLFILEIALWRIELERAD